MARSVLSNLFWAFVVLCLLILVNAGKDEDQSSDITQPKPKKQLTQPVSESSAAAKLFKPAYDAVWTLREPEEKLNAIKHALKVAKETEYTGTYEINKLHLAAADIHQDRWHYHFAINSLVAAQKVEFNRTVDNRIKRLRTHLQKVEKERNFNADYIATRDSGPARSFTGKVLVTYIFVDDGIKTRWSKKTLHRSEQVLNLVQRWHKQQSEAYKVENLFFENKFFTAKRNPRLKQLSSVSLKTQREKVNEYISAIMYGLGEKSLEDFIANQLKIAEADQAVVIFHSNFDERSFARRCGMTHKRTQTINGVPKVDYFSRCKEEFVMLMSKVERNRWDKLHYTQAHEILHLFGADDLYNIKGAGAFALTDIMNFQSKKLDDSDIHPITAYAVGWQKQKPNTPFRVLDK